MISGLYLYRASLVFRLLKALYNTGQHSPIHRKAASLQNANLLISCGIRGRPTRPGPTHFLTGPPNVDDALWLEVEVWSLIWLLRLCLCARRLVSWERGVMEESRFRVFFSCCFRCSIKFKTLRTSRVKEKCKCLCLRSLQINLSPHVTKSWRDLVLIAFYPDMRLLSLISKYKVVKDFIFFSHYMYNNVVFSW